MDGQRPLSPTQLNMLQRCQMQYHWRYVEGIRAPPGVAQLVGGGTHKSIERNMRHKIEAGSLLTAEAVEAAARDEVLARWNAEGVHLGEEERQRPMAALQGEAIDDAVRLARLHHRALAPAIEPAHVEREFLLKVPGGRDLAGFIDLQERAGRVIDTKTSAKSPSEADITNAGRLVQLTMYGLAVRTLDGPRKSYPMRIDYLVKSREAKAVTVETERTDEDFRGLMMRVEVATKVIDSGNFMPASPDDWCCSERWCGYFHRCPYGARRRSAAVAAHGRGAP